MAERYVIVKTIEKVSQKLNEDGSIDYVVRRAFHALPIDEAERFIERFCSETRQALRVFEVEAIDILAITSTLQILSRKVEAKEAPTSE